MRGEASLLTSSSHKELKFKIMTMNIVPFPTSPPTPSLGGVRFPGEVGWLAPYGGAPSHFGGLFTV